MNMGKLGAVSPASQDGFKGFKNLNDVSLNSGSKTSDDLIIYYCICTFAGTLFACGVELKNGLAISKKRHGIYQVDLQGQRSPMPWVTQYDVKGLISASAGSLYFGLDRKLHMLKLQGRNPKSGPFAWDDVIFTPFEIKSSSACASSQKLYISGSEDPISAHKVTVYDEASRRFYALTPMTQKREGHSSLLWENNLVVVGGYYDSTVLPSAEFLDPRSGKWTAMPPLPEPVYYHATCICDNNLVVTGGYLETETRSNRVWSLDLGAMTSWEELPSMVSPRDDHGTISTEDGSLVVLGGNRPGPPTVEVLQRGGKWVELGLKFNFKNLDKATAMTL